MLRRLALALTAALLIGAAPATADTADRLERLGGRPCSQGSEFVCVTLTVPLDHFDPADTRTTRVVFAVRPADDASRGLFVTATGGPGSSGIEVAEWYTESLPPRMLRLYDLVYFDQRGMGRSGGLACPQAAARAVLSEADAARAGQAFAANCTAELRSRRLLPYMGTAQAVEDLEALRVALDGPGVYLYGESYGTQYVQTYAAAHPGPVRRMAIDGVVDLTLTGPQFWASASASFERVLVDTLRICGTRTGCRRDLGGDPLGFYERLLARLERGPLPVRVPGTRPAVTRQLTRDLLAIAVSASLYSPAGRAALLGSLADARRGDRWPLLETAYINAGLDPSTLDPAPDPAWSDAVYYGVDCRDYRYYDGTPSERSAAFLAEADAVGARYPLIGWSTAQSDYACVWWPAPEPGPERPAPLVLPGVPVLVANATADPITPMDQARDVAARLADGYLLTTRGGAHVMWGRGNDCVEAAYRRFFVGLRAPAERRTFCSHATVDPYAPLERGRRGRR
ncbi:MAG: alpha/beta fold hydrolase [Actinomycetota bacterium]